MNYCSYSTKLFFTLLVRKNLYLNFFITSFSQYTTICFVSFVYSVFNEQFRVPLLYAGGDDGIRTHDPLLAGQVLSQLSYTPILWGLLFSPFFKEARLEAPSYVPVLMSRGFLSFLLDSSSLTLYCFNTLWVLFSLDESTRSLCTTYGFYLFFYFFGRPKWTRTTDLVLIRHAL